MNNILNSAKLSLFVRIRLVTVLGILFCLLGLAAIVLSIIELFQGRPKAYHYDSSQGGLTVENPLWPSAGKGFWVGLLLFATGLVGILASREWTPPSLIGFTVLATISTVFSFYLTITSIIPVQYDAKYSDSSRPSWQSNELILNSLLIATGGLAVILGTITSLLGCCFAGCCADQRSHKRYSNEPDHILVDTPKFSRYARQNNAN